MKTARFTIARTTAGGRPWYVYDYVNDGYLLPEGYSIPYFNLMHPRREATWFRTREDARVAMRNAKLLNL